MVAFLCFTAVVACSVSAVSAARGTAVHKSGGTSETTGAAATAPMASVRTTSELQEMHAALQAISLAGDGEFTLEPERSHAKWSAARAGAAALLDSGMLEHLLAQPSIAQRFRTLLTSENGGKREADTD
eukprot:COSAG06_NODE_18345_length_892_cov_0.982346_1_plen_128_part_10